MPVEPRSDDGGCRGPGAHPMQVGYALTGDGGCIARARHHAADFLTRLKDEHGLSVAPRAIDLTQLVVSELVTNARKYASGPVLMELRISGTTVVVAVWDSDPTVPTARATDPDRIGQHGLEIVEGVTQSLAVQRQTVGKRITARIALTDAPGAGATARDLP
ncbi:MULTISPECIES: ATP-binding protein [unclassified Streptomyces]|uniref:ATP-binding protein n=2 Tax=unclassified Streptomyces TaxID=2593676 RepID=UPI002E18C283